MRELNKQDMIDLSYGCAVLGTGGGGPLADCLALLAEHFEKGKTLKLITLDYGRLPFLLRLYICRSRGWQELLSPGFRHESPTTRPPPESSS